MRCGAGCSTGLRTRSSGSTRTVVRRRRASPRWRTRWRAMPSWSTCWRCGRAGPTCRSSTASPSCWPRRACPTWRPTATRSPGLRKRAAWEHTWDLQRREDAGTYDPSPEGSRRRRSDPGAAEVHQRRLRPRRVLVAPRQARRAQGAVHPLPRRRPRDRPDAGARLGRLGPRSAGARAGDADPAAPRPGRLDRRAAGAAGGRVWPRCCRGWSSGTPSPATSTAG